LLSPDSIQEGEEENISVVAQGIPLRIGCVERIAPGLTNIIENNLKMYKNTLEHIFVTQPPLHCRQIFDRRQI
jgi:hypothetical protein